MTQPMTPSDCDLRDYVWMPLDCNRLLTSETWVLGNAEEKVAALTLWMKSWHQVPAGSLPNNDRMLAHMSEAGSRWPKVREHALRGWVLCDDGRLYHPVVAEKARESWEHKQAQKARTEAARAAKAAKRQGPADRPQASAASSVTEPVTDVATGSTRPDQTRPDLNTTLAGGSARARERGLAPLPEGWQPAERAEPPLDHAAVLARFTDWCRAKSATSADWDASWRNWCRDEAKRPKPPLHTQPQAEQDRRILAAAGALGFADPPPPTVVPLRIAQ